jgi:hypothetical protein
MRRMRVPLLAAALASAALPAGAVAAADGVDAPAVVRAESGSWHWWLSNGFDATVARHFLFGSSSHTPVAGDWDGNGTDTPGVKTDGNRWLLSNGYDGSMAHDFHYGLAGDVPLVGDWNGDGRDTIAIRRGHCFYWKHSLSGGAADAVTCFGNPGDVPVVGDWDGNGTDSPGVFRDAHWYLNNDFSGTVHAHVVFGLPRDRPIPGDFDGNGTDTPAIHRGNAFHLSNDLSGATHRALTYGNPGDVGLVGDWDGGGSAGGGGGGGSGVRGPSFDEVEVEAYPSSERQLASAGTPIWARYAPAVSLHPREDAFPARALHFFIRNSELIWSNHNESDYKATEFGQTEARRLGVRSWTDAYAACGWYAWQLTRPYQSGRPSGPPPFGGCELETRDGFVLNLRDAQHGGEPGALAEVPVYYEFPRENGGYIVYWFFYAYNRTRAHGQDRARFDHEGDWERIVVDLNARNRPKQVAYYRHGCRPARVEWPNVPRTDSTGRRSSSGTHPLVYSARGRHGSYAEVRDGTRAHCESGWVGDDHVARGGPQWRTWERMARVDRQPWFGYGGAWGSIGCNHRGALCDLVLARHTTGPLGPYPGQGAPPRGW